MMTSSGCSSHLNMDYAVHCILSYIQSATEFLIIRYKVWKNGINGSENANISPKMSLWPIQIHFFKSNRVSRPGVTLRIISRQTYTRNFHYTILEVFHPFSNYSKAREKEKGEVQ